MIQSNKGLTLIELLVVVAIVGVLSVLGRVGFRNARRKAQAAEAKAILGAIYRGESVFYSEYGAYANRLDFLGVNSSVDASKRFYSTGFPLDPLCDQQPDPLPEAITESGKALNAKSPTYYTQPGLVSVFRREANDGTPQGRCLAYTFPSDGSSFTATATGVKEGVDFTNTGLSLGDNGDFDVWAMDNQGSLMHTYSPN